MNRFIPLMLVLLLAAWCVRPMPPAVPMVCPPLKTQWYDNGGVYRLRHSGVLRIGETVLPLSGFMVLDTVHHRAKVAVLTGLGMTLASLDVEVGRWTALSASPVARHIPHFLDQCALSIRRMFLTGFPTASSSCAVGDGQPRWLAGQGEDRCEVFLGPSAGELTKRAAKGRRRWSVTYRGQGTEGLLSLPEEIVYADPGRRVVVTLKLKEASLQ